MYKYLSMVLGGIAVVAIIVVGIMFFASDKKAPVEVALAQEEGSSPILAGYIGVIEGVKVVEAASGPHNALGTSAEEVLVGQRMTEREIDTLSDVGDQVKESVDDIDEQSWKLAKQTQMTDGDYETLLAVVEAEAGGEDVKGRMMVANVILNRVKYERFPDNVTDVVWQKVGGAAQFTPTVDGRISKVTISDKTREAVNRVIDGEDLSQGALFFMGKATAEEHNKKWFNGSLEFLFEHGVHSFYTY